MSDMPEIIWAGIRDGMPMWVSIFKDKPMFKTKYTRAAPEVDAEGFKRKIHKHFCPLHSYQGSTVITIDKMIDHPISTGVLKGVG